MLMILKRLGACAEAREWVGSRTLAEAWAECERPDWLLWLHARSESADAAGYAVLAGKWAALARASAADAGKRAAAWAEWAERAAWAEWAERAEAAAERAAAAWGKQAAMDANLARVWATDEWAVNESRARQCNDIRAALCCPVFNTPGQGGKDEATK